MSVCKWDVPIFFYLHPSLPKMVGFCTTHSDFSSKELPKNYALRFFSRGTNKSFRATGTEGMGQMEIKYG